MRRRDKLGIMESPWEGLIEDRWEDNATPHPHLASKGFPLNEPGLSNTLNQPLLSKPNPSSHDFIHPIVDGSFTSSHASLSVDRYAFHTESPQNQLPQSEPSPSFDDDSDRWEDNASPLPGWFGSDLHWNQPLHSEPNPNSHDSIYAAPDGSFTSSRVSPSMDQYAFGIESPQNQPLLFEPSPSFADDSDRWEDNASPLPGWFGSDLHQNQPLHSEPNPSSHDSIYAAPDGSLTSSRVSPSMNRWEDNATPFPYPIGIGLPQNQSVLSQPNPSPRTSFFKKSLDWFFPIAILLLEVLSEIFNQMSSEKRPDLGLVVTVVSFATLLACIIELILRGCKEKVAWRKWGMIYWFLHPNGSPFGTLIDVTGLICSILQCVFASIAYASFHNHDDDPIKLSVWPIIFALGLLFSKIYQQKCNSGTVTEPGPGPGPGPEIP